MKARPPRLLSFAKALACSLCLTVGLASVATLHAQTTSVLSTGDDFGALVDANGNLFVWGAIATEVAAGEVQQIEPSESWVDVSVSRTSAASAHILAIDTNGTLWAWGANSRGQVGDGTTTDRAEPYQVSTSTDWVEIAAGEFHSMARREDGSIYLWGGNSYGQLGYGPIFNDPDLDLETSIGGAMDEHSYIAIAAGKLHSHAVREDGTLWGWGQNGDSGGSSNGKELGFQIAGNPPVGPVEPTQLNHTGWTDLFSGYDSVFALRNTANETGQLWTWGAGALGQGSVGASSWTPVRVGLSSNWASVSTSKSSNKPHTLGLKSDGSLYGWGVNWDQGQLGLPLTDNGSQLTENYSKTTPFRLMSEDTFLAVGAGEGFSAVIRADGLMLTAGINDVGQLANAETNGAGTGQDFFYNSSLGLADLQGEGVTVSTQLPWTSSTVSASFTMKNGGTGTIEDEFYLSAVLSPSENYDHVDAVQLEFSPGETELLVTDSLTAGQSLAVPFTFLLPDSVLQGSYYLVVRADPPSLANPEGLIAETNEDNNDAATVENYQFFPDLIVDSLAVTGGSFLPGEDLTIDIGIQNQGEGTIAAGSTFDIRLFLSPDKTSDNSAAVDLDAAPGDDLETVFEVELASDLDPGDTLTLDTFTLEIPRMGGGYYFVGVDVDVTEQVTEQTEIVINNVVVREDGEDNNLTFTATASIEITGIEIPEAIDQPLLTFTTSEDGDWFGQNVVFNDDPALIGNDDAVQSPSLAVGDSAAFSTDLDGGATPYAITFDWKSETSSIDNKLIYRVINGATGGLFNEISGVTEWTTMQRVVPANARAEWVYEKGTDANSDAVYVDNLQVTEVTAPDLVIDDIYLPDDATASYVLLKDNLDLTVNSRNQGTDTLPTDNYVISIYLSKDRTLDRPDTDPATADDILIRQEAIAGGIASGDPAVNGFSILLDSAIDDGDYYIIGYIDDFNLPDSTSGNGQVLEFVDLAINFDGEGNNSFVSTNTIEIVALPDLIVSELNAEPDYYLIEDPVTGEANSMEFDFTVANIGLTSVNADVATSIVFSQDQIIDPASDYLLLDYSYNGNFGALDDAPANERLISPDAIDFRQDLVDAGYIGRRLFVGVHIDSDNTVDELDEDHNSSYLLNNDFILSELPILDGLDIDSAMISDHSITLLNDEVAPYDSEKQPWVGQTSESVDSFDAVTNVIVGDDETSEFSINIEPTTGVRVSFWWKVSSEYQYTNGVTHIDTLGFYVDGAEAVSPIFGTDEDWRRVEITLEPGPHTLTWAYTKDDQGSAGEDRGWVDNFFIEEIPNLTVSGVTVDDLPVYAGGDTINTWSVAIQNTGAAIEAGTSFDIPVRLLSEGSWSESNSVDLLMITDPNTTGLAAGASRTYDQTTDLGDGALGALTLPADYDYAQEFYYLGAYVDWSLSDLDNGQIIESDETDNSAVTDVASIQVGLPDLTGDSSSISGLVPSYEFGDSVDIDLTFTNTGDGRLAAGSNFDYAVYIAQTNDDLLLNTASVVLLGTGTVDVDNDVASGVDLDPANLVANLPYGLSEGDYYLAVQFDVDNDVEEQGLRPDDTGEDGEANNLFFSGSAVFQVTGISLQTALDDDTSPLALGTFENDPDSAAFWFGRDDAGDGPVDDDQTFEEGEGAQSPALNQGDEASFQLLVPVSSVVKFDWGIFSDSDLNVLSVLVNGVVIDSISGNEPFAGVDPGILVPDDGTVEWRYSQGASTQGDFAVVDNVRVETNSQPDLVVSAINYTPGEYVLDVSGIADAPNQLLGTEYLDITVEAKNQGMGLVATSFTSADLEVRLSISGEWEDPEHIVLGSVSQVEGNLDSGNLMRFIGPIQLGDSIPENSYYLMAKVDSTNALTEFNEGNNVFVSENRDVTIKRLPALRIYNPDASMAFETGDGVNNYLDPRAGGAVAFDLDENLFYYSESAMRLRFSVQNIGLGRVEGSEIWTTQVNLLGAQRVELDTAISQQEVIDAFSVLIELGDFTIQELLEGRSETKPDGDLLDIDLDLALPSGVRLNEAIAEGLSITDYLWIIEVTLDSTDVVQESEIISEEPEFVTPSGLPWWIFNVGEAFYFSDFYSTNTDQDEGLFGISFQPSVMDATDWELLNPGYPTTNDDYLLAYAFNRNPADSDTVGGQFPGVSGITEIEGEDYYRLTFDFVTRAEDLVYYVEASADMAFDPILSPDYTLLAEIQGPYNQLTGAASLTGDGGLIDQVYEVIPGVGGLPDEEVVVITNVLDEGYTARVTVRDHEPVGSYPTRFFRVRVESLNSGLSPIGDEDNDGVDNLTESLAGSDPRDSSDLPSAVAQYVAEQLIGLGVTVANDSGPVDDRDGDGMSNIAELLYGTDPTVPGALTITLTEQFVAEEMAAFGVFDTVAVNFAPSDDFDLDGVSNLVELQYGTDPTVQSSSPVVDEVDIFVAEQMAAFGEFGLGAASVDPDADYDSDGYSNLVELQYGSNPNSTTAGDVPVMSSIEVFVAEEMAYLGAYGFGIANIGPNEDYDTDTVSNLAEIYAGTDPTSAAVVAATVVDYVTAEMAARGVTSGAIAPGDDFDLDSVNNLVELQYGTDPTVQSSSPIVDEVDIFVAEQMADVGALGVGAAAVAPSFDYDSDGVSNLIELLDGTNPNDVADSPTLSQLEMMVAEEMAAAGALGVGIANIGPNDDYDADGADNLTEIYRNTDPTVVAVVPAAVATYVDTQMDALGATSGLVEAHDDFDGDGVSNLVELQHGNSPINDANTPVVDDVAIFVAQKMAEFAILGSVDVTDPNLPLFTAALDATPGDDSDGDGISNLVELLHGTDPTAADVSVLTALEIGVAEAMASFGALGFNIPDIIGPFDDYDGDGNDNVTEIFILGSDPTQP